MSAERQDGGAAFPCEYQSFGGGYDRGMSLRDWFAGQALVGGLSYPGDDMRGSWHNNATPDVVATICYAYADALLRAREEAPDA